MASELLRSCYYMFGWQETCQQQMERQFSVTIDCLVSVSLTFLSSLCFSVLLSEDSPQDNGVQTNQYSSISPPASPVAQEEPFSTYFEDKVHIPENVSQVLTMLHSYLFM